MRDLATRDGQRSRRRILDAATSEFAAFGIAGARVDRIAATARVNKAQLYAYFGSKDGLFDAVFADRIAAIVDAVPLDAHDLPSHAVGLYDEYLAHPELVRLATWARLERTPTGDLFPPTEEASAHKLRAIADAQAAGVVEPALAPQDVLALVVGISLTWSPSSLLRAASPDEPADVHEHRRRALAEMARRMFAPAPFA